jgi:hypothetical protein
MRLRKRDRIDAWLKDKHALMIKAKQTNFRFYAYELAHALGYETAEVVPYLKWHRMVTFLKDAVKEPNWEIVKGVRG